MQSRLLATAGETPLWISPATMRRPHPKQPCANTAPKFCALPKKTGRLGLGEVLKLLAKRGITRLMVEGGPAVASALIEADLIDEAVFFHSPVVIGEEGLPALEPRARSNA